jgi:hypothetical protein
VDIGYRRDSYPSMEWYQLLTGGRNVTLTRQDTEQAANARGWSWAALAAAFVVWMTTLPTWGLSVILSPITILLSGLAWRRSQHDAVFWIGLALNALLVLGFFGVVVSILTGEISVE